MDQGNAVSPGASVTTLARKSWTAYVKVTLLGVVLLLLVVPMAWRASAGVGVLALLLVIAFIGYQVLSIRSHHLYFDEMGVWLDRGILPWNKGVVGVKWRDLDEAVFFQNVWSWLFKSYTIRVGHRFTKSSELVLTHMARGHEAVMDVNSNHQELVRQNLLN